MKFVKLTSLFAVIALAVLSLAFASASTLFLDDFNSGVPSQWTPGTWTLSSGYLESGASSANNSINSIATRSASTSNFNNIVLSFDRWLFDSGNNNFETGNNFIVSISYDGVTFVQVSSVTGSTATSFTSQSFTLNSSANNNSNFKIRFECSTDSGNEFCRIDNVRIDGNPISSSNINIVISGAEPSGNQPYSTNQNITLTLTNTGSTPLSVAMSQTGTLSGLTFNPSNPLTLNPNIPVDVKAILRGLTGLRFGPDNIVNIRATSSSQVATTSFNVKKTFCSAGQTLNSNLTIDSVSWDNNGEGEENDWELLDEIEVEMDIKNNNQDDEVDVVAVLGLFDSSGNDVSDELTFLGDSREDEEQIEISIDDDSEETVNWEFKVPADFDAGEYKLAVKVYDEDAGQNNDCKDTASELDENFYQPITIEQTSDEGRFVIVDEIELDNQLTCGETATGQFTVFNVGEDDEERVRITIRNRDLNIDLVREITSDLDQGEDETLDFSVTIPATVPSGTYTLEFLTEYDYDDGVYDQEGDESFDYSFEVIGCTQNTGNPGSGGLTNIRIDAELDSEAKAGEELVVVATVSNTGTEDATYSISARGYSSWAELTDISPGTISVDAGESKEVIIKMMVNKDTSGLQSFDMQVSEGSRSQIQEIEVELASSDSLGLLSSGSSLIWIIGAVNLILIILIIVVAIRVSRR
ncbi:MAG: putative S-layer protein [Nanoarchaeota archaeon]